LALKIYKGKFQDMVMSQAYSMVFFLIQGKIFFKRYFHPKPFFLMKGKDIPFIILMDNLAVKTEFALKIVADIDFLSRTNIILSIF
jgi:hypothetical protein